MIGPGISDPVAMFAFRQNHAGEGGGFPVEVAAIHGGPFVEVLKHPRLGVLEGIRTVGIREMLFPDTSVIIPCSVLLKNRDCVVGTRADSVS